VASQNTPKQPEKISADCPHCGFSQLESAYAKSTFCRKCGQHYSIEKLLAKEVTSLKEPSLFDKLSKLVGGEKEREICCFSCGHKQQVSSAAQSSQCPHCSSYIDLRDFKIAGPFGRSIQTQGEVVITAKGDVTSSKIACGSATIEGKMRGNLTCTGEVRVKYHGKILGGIEAHRLILEKKSDVDFVRPLKVQSAEINGKASARIMCDGCVSISKGGSLEGVVYAKSINVEKGGIFSGELFIGQQEFTQPDLLAPAEGSQDHFDDDSFEFGPA
jgi:cytoskeletal protein CcmA (bactofilin family)